MTPDTAHPDETAQEQVDLDNEQAAVDPALFEKQPAEPPFARTVHTTPLHLLISAESRTNRWTEWNGYTVPDVLTDLGDEYRALRGAAILADHSPLVKTRISGRDATDYLQRLVTRDLSSLAVHAAIPVIFCEGAGLVLGDGILFRLGDEEYRLVTEETHLAWMTESALGFRVRIEDVSATLATLSLQGPLSAACLRDAGVKDIDSLAPFAACWADIGGMPVYVSRTGASGDLGYELWADAEDAPHLWRRLMNKGMSHGLRPAGFALRELARLEAALPRAGRDYLSAFAAVLSCDAATPFELWSAPAISLNKPVFNGGRALRRLADKPPRRRLVALVAEALEPVALSTVLSGTRPVGTATTAGFSPALGANIALALVETSALDGSLSLTGRRREGLSTQELVLPARIMEEPAWKMARGSAFPAAFGL
jgi:aminomethyltransferase